MRHLGRVPVVRETFRGALEQPDLLGQHHQQYRPPVGTQIASTAVHLHPPRTDPFRHPTHQPVRAALLLALHPVPSSIRPHRPRCAHPSASVAAYPGRPFQNIHRNMHSTTTSVFSTRRRRCQSRTKASSGAKTAAGDLQDPNRSQPFGLNQPR